MRLRSALQLLVVLGVAQALPACGQTARPLSPGDVDRLPSAHPDAQLAYGPAPEQFGELRLPAGDGRVPVAVIIHGGCWLADVASVENTRAMADGLRRAGVATWNIEYRRVGSPGGGWPSTFHDVGAAVDFVRTLARRYPRLDTARVVVVGHSAGAHLALWAAARHRLPSNSALRGLGTPLRPRGVAALDGPPDLAAFVRAGAPACGSDVIRELLGGDQAAVPVHWHDASPADLLPLGVPTQLIAGVPNGLMPAGLCEAWVRQAHAAGDTAARFIPVAGAGHFEVIAPTAPAFTVVQEAVRVLAGLPASRP